MMDIKFEVTPLICRISVSHLLSQYILLLVVMFISYILHYVNRIL